MCPSSPTADVADEVARLVAEAGLEPAGLRAAFAAVPDPRDPRGVRHRLEVILGLACAAVLAGCQGLTAIGEWIADAPQEALDVFGPGMSRPSESCVRRTFTALPPATLETAIGAWIGRAQGSDPDAEPVWRAVAVDGKRLRGSYTDRPGSGTARHLMSGFDHHTGVVLAQREVAAKTNEIPEFAPLVDTIADLSATVVTADAMHTQTAHARYLVQQRGADYLVTVKGNQPELQAQLAALPWGQVPIGWVETDRAHGRIEHREIQLASVKPGLAFPHAAQAMRITRHIARVRDGASSTETVYAITSLPAEQATARDLARIVRGHWSIENRLHWVRDVTFDEDRSRVRTGHAPHIMATLRNLTIGILRLLGETNIARALRRYARHPLRTSYLLATI